MPASAKLVEPLGVAHAGHGSRFMMTIKVDTVDAVCTELRAHGVIMLNCPLDRPWARRTAAFSGPAGHVREVAQELV